MCNMQFLARNLCKCRQFKGDVRRSQLKNQSDLMLTKISCSQIICHAVGLSSSHFVFPCLSCPGVLHFLPFDCPLCPHWFPSLSDHLQLPSVLRPCVSFSCRWVATLTVIVIRFTLFFFADEVIFVWNMDSAVDSSACFAKMTPFF